MLEKIPKCSLSFRKASYAISLTFFLQKRYPKYSWKDFYIYHLGIDLGGTNIVAGVITDSYKSLFQCFMVKKFSLIFKINPSGCLISPFYVFTQDKTWVKV